MGEPIDGQRKLKQGYAKKGFQSPYANIGESVDPNPPPPSSYSTTTHVATTPVQPGLVPRPATREVVALGNIASFRNYNDEVFPWHLVPKANSSNIIQRAVLDAGTIGATGTLGQAADVFSIFVSDSGNAPQLGSNIGTPIPANLSNEYWSIKKFGHAELLAGATTPGSTITYEIIVDGDLVLSWNNFQLSPSSPYNQLWEFENPLSVNESLVFRVRYGGVLDYDFSVAGQNVDCVFVGWTEQYVYGADDRYTNVEPI